MQMFTVETTSLTSISSVVIYGLIEEVDSELLLLRAFFIRHSSLHPLWLKAHPRIKKNSPASPGDVPCPVPASLDNRRIP